MSTSERWRFPATADRAISLFAPPTVTDDGQVLVGGFNGVVYALKASDGSLAWQSEPLGDRIIGGVAVAGDLILVRAPAGPGSRLVRVGLGGSRFGSQRPGPFHGRA